MVAKPWLLKTIVVMEPETAVGVGVGVLLGVVVGAGGVVVVVELIGGGLDAEVEGGDEDDAGCKEDTEDVGWRVDCNTKILAFEHETRE